MIIKNLEVSEIVLTKVDYKKNNIQLQIRFTHDSPVTLDFNFENNFDLFVNKIIKQIKLLKKPQDNEDNEFLGGISIVNIINEEEIKEKVPKRLFLLDRRLGTVKQTTNYKDYMNLYSQLSTLEETIYEK